MLTGCLRCSQIITRDLFASFLSLLCPLSALLAPCLLAARFHNPPSLLLLLVLTLKHHWMICHRPCSCVLLIFIHFQCLTYCSSIFHTPSYNHIGVKSCCSPSPVNTSTVWDLQPPARSLRRWRNRDGSPESCKTV